MRIQLYCNLYCIHHKSQQQVRVQQVHLKTVTIFYKLFEFYSKNYLTISLEL